MGGNRLSENPNISVLLLEAGHANTRELFSRAPAAFTKMFGTKVDWAHWTEGGQVASGVKGRKMQWPRGRMLGGCTAINGAHTVQEIRRHPADAFTHSYDVNFLGLTAYSLGTDTRP